MSYLFTLVNERGRDYTAREKDNRSQGSAKLVLSNNLLSELGLDIQAKCACVCRQGTERAGRAGQRRKRAFKSEPKVSRLSYTFGFWSRIQGVQHFYCSH